MLKVNEQWVVFQPGMRLREVAASYKPDADLFIVNGYPVEASTMLHRGDFCWLLRRGEIPSSEEMQRLLHARHTPGVHAKVSRSIVGIMGLGGLGSAVAVALARLGIGTLILADYDVVEPTNLNRQQYFVDQIGLKKTDALRQNLARINPYVAVETIEAKLTEESIPDFFRGVEVLAECFDDAVMKAAALRAVLINLPEMAYVGSSGMAGYGENNRIRTRKLRERIYLVGDYETAAAPGQGLMAPRVGIAAHHQANQILRLLLDQNMD